MLKNYVKECKLCNRKFDSLHWSRNKCDSCVTTLQSKIKNPKLVRSSQFRKYTKLCIHCNTPFIAGDAKAKCCNLCGEKILVVCNCGCKKEFYKTRFKYLKNPYWYSHNKRGKTYLEIYGTEKPGCGFPSGDLNPNFTKQRFTGLKYTNTRGEKFRSSLEVKFADYCFENNIPYDNEVVVNLNNGRKKIVDFVLYGYVLIEITGFASNLWKESFLEKIQHLRNSVDNPIIVLTYNQNLTEDSRIWECPNFDLMIRSIQDLHNIPKVISFYKIINYGNSILFGDQYIDNLTNFKKHF